MQIGQRNRLTGQDDMIWCRKFTMMRPVRGKLTRHDAREVERIPKVEQHCVQEQAGQINIAEDDHVTALLLHSWTQTGVQRL
jgi:hypothetical protein